MPSEIKQLREVEEALRVRPKDRTLHLRRVTLLGRLNQPERLREALTSAACELDDVFFMEALANLLEREGRWVDALEWRRLLLHYQGDDLAAEGFESCRYEALAQECEQLMAVARGQRANGGIARAMDQLQKELERRSGYREVREALNALQLVMGRPRFVRASPSLPRDLEGGSGVPGRLPVQPHLPAGSKEQDLPEPE